MCRDIWRHGSARYEDAILANFSFVNTTTWNMVSIRVKTYLTYDGYDEGEKLDSQVFKIEALLNHWNERVESPVELMSFNRNDGHTLCVKAYGHRVPIKMDKEATSRVATFLGVSDVNSFITAVLKCLSLDTSFDDIQTSGTIKEVDASIKDMNYSELHSYVRSIHLRNQLIYDLRKGKQFFFKQDSDCVWMNPNSASTDERFLEVIELAQKVSSINDKRENLGCSPLISESQVDGVYVADSISIEIKSLNSTSVHDIRFTFGIEGLKDEIELNEFMTICFDKSKLFEAHQDLFAQVAYDEELTKQAMKTLGCQHMTLVDFCDFVFACTTRGAWIGRDTSEETPKYSFSLEALKKWTRSVTPMIHDDDER